MIKSVIVEEEEMWCDKCGNRIAVDMDFDDPPYHTCVICGKDYCHHCYDKFKFVYSRHSRDGGFCEDCQPLVNIMELKNAVNEEYRKRNNLEIQRENALDVVNKQYDEYIENSRTMEDTIVQYYVDEGKKKLGVN